ncbi:MAG: T9SS C-terminal target domain-containing protein [Calditrichaeota bacterium]|nr:MAG: T9SS C-terminal target domain-containing protein [Calditrichota bacterium]
MEFKKMKLILKIPKIFFKVLYCIIYTIFSVSMSNAVTIDFSTYIGGFSEDFSVEADVNSKNEIVISGNTSSTNFPTTSGVFDNLYNGGSWDSFISKLSKDASTLQFSTFIGGNSSDTGTNVFYNQSEDKILIIGTTSSSNFPTKNAYSDTFNLGYDSFISCFSNKGDSLIYSTYIGGSNTDFTLASFVDKNDNVYVSGRTFSLDFPTTLNAFSQTSFGNWESFISKISSNGDSLIASTLIGGNQQDENFDIEIDKFGNPYITGFTFSINYPTTSGAFQVYPSGNSEIYVSKFTNDMSILNYSTYLGGSSTDYGNSIAIDKNLNAFITGSTSSTDFPIFNGYDASFNGGEDIFLSKVSSDGSILLYSSFLGGNSSERSYNVSLDLVSNVYLSGHTSSIDFPIFNGVNNNGSNDYFIVSLNIIDNSINYSTCFGSTLSETFGSSNYTNGSLYLTGNTESNNFLSTSGSYSQINSGGNDVTLTKFLFFNQPLKISQIQDKSYLEDSGVNLVVNLDSIFINPDSSSALVYSTSVSGSGINSYINSDSLLISTITDSTGDYQIIVTALKDSITTVSDSFLITIIPVNDPPTVFNLLNPTDGDTLPNFFDPIEFIWNSSIDADNTNLIYNLKIFNSSFDTTISNISDTTLNFTSSLEELTNYNWFVEVTDGEFTVSSSDTFEFITPMAVSISENENQVPNSFALRQNYPNPFNPTTTISYDLPINSKVILKIYNLIGQEVRALVEKNVNAGFHLVNWDGKNDFGKQVSSGIYIYKIQAGDFVQSKKMVFLK